MIQLITSKRWEKQFKLSASALGGGPNWSDVTWKQILKATTHSVTWHHWSIWKIALNILQRSRPKKSKYGGLSSCHLTIGQKSHTTVSCHWSHDFNALRPSPPTCYMNVSSLNRLKKTYIGMHLHSHHVLHSQLKHVWMECLWKLSNNRPTPENLEKASKIFCTNWARMSA